MSTCVHTGIRSAHGRSHVLQLNGIQCFNYLLSVSRLSVQFVSVFRYSKCQTPSKTQANKQTNTETNRQAPEIEFCAFLALKCDIW